jgi:hypothetical protein
MASLQDKKQLIKEIEADEVGFDGFQEFEGYEGNMAYLGDVTEKYLNDKITDEQFEQALGQKKSPLGMSLGEAIMTFVHNPQVNVVLSEYIARNGMKKVGTQPAEKAMQVYAIDKKLRSKFKNMKKQKFAGSDEKFEQYCNSQSYKKQEESFVRENEASNYTGGEMFAGEEFEGIIPLVAGAAATPVGKKIIGGAVKGVGKLFGKKKKTAGNAAAAAKIAEWKSKLEEMKANAIKSGVDANVVGAVTSKLSGGNQAVTEQAMARWAGDRDAKAKANLAILGTVLEKSIPEKILEEAKDMKDRYIAEQTKTQVSNMVPYMIAGVIAIIFVVLLINKK